MAPAHAPLVAWLEVETEHATELAVRITQNEDCWTIRFPIAARYLLLCFHPTGRAEITVQAIGPEGAVTWAEALVHDLCDVPTSPLEMPPLQTHKSQPGQDGGEFHLSDHPAPGHGPHRRFDARQSQMDDHLGHADRG